MPASKIPEHRSASETAIAGPPTEHVGVASGPPRDVDYGERLREAERLVDAPEWQARPSVERDIEELGQIFPSDPRAAFVLLNESRYRTIQGVFGVRRDQVNLMSLVAAMTVAEAVHAKTQRLRRSLRGPTRGDMILGDAFLNGLGQQIMGPSTREVPFLAALIGAAAVGTVAVRVVRRSAQDVKVASREVTRSLRRFFSFEAGRIAGSTR